MSRSGWAVVDDSDTYVLNPKSGWWDQGQNADQVDLYMFGHGHAYKQALQDLLGYRVKSGWCRALRQGYGWTRGLPEHARSGRHRGGV